ncbi:MAG: gamma-aminobutyrate dehydratase [Candidatus Tectomicrobia bacterium]|uniref:Gamma-aminobutyrate dehydratase n=1 Tax=Tectimicrobiota bacterium TaxID=2528274 RepID=A0A932GMD3_UNCTE|nr:gamma-aminobutyrate dehydratase [Candidatus Tectomicrobia bacterium]
MGLRTASQYLESLRDGRAVFYRGERISDVTCHPLLRVAAEHTALEYRLAEEEPFRDLLVVDDPETREPISRYFHIPRSSEDLHKRGTLIETTTREGGSVVLLIKDIGSDALFALHIVAQAVDRAHGTRYLDKVKRYYEKCKREDLALAVAQTDVKGNRSLRPSQQAHPDYYVRVVRETPEGIVVRGAKAHTTNSVLSNELIVLPTRALGEQDRDYAVAFALPINHPGLKLIASPSGFEGAGTFHHPVSARHKMIESLTIFDDVLVPWDRVFLKGEWTFAGPLASTFVEFHRFTAISYKGPLLDLLVGSAALMAEYNGIARASHVQDKLARLCMYVATVKGLTQAAALNYKLVEGIAVPDPVLTNTAKYFFARNYHEAVRDVQDIAGGLLVTGPGEEDLQNPETSSFIHRYLGGKAEVAAEHRLRLMNLIRDLTASNFGGYNEVLAIHAEGSMEAQKITLLRDFDLETYRAFARRMAGLP